MGTLFGVSATLAIQWFANRKVRKALRALEQAPAQPSEEVLLLHRERAEMGRRLAALEEIVTDRPKRLAHEIDSLR
ncbi:MAG: hypothetical protein E7773_10345 [Sphingomonas sp.]|uniref:hypothetical protein n=1 Tax=Sphingomonas sp. TaxID=28214 RepID=UPI001200F1F3|nr:hypothetical protein [Sphingomonas sp.]THD35735.1 MAG: hypothetical protein E7773_10345 [Sphingomonas sp.]